MTTIASFVSQKGGVGKTMCATNVATGLALLHGKRVCLIDLDEQASAAVSVGVVAPQERPALKDTILEGRLVDSVFQSPIEGLYAVPADPTVNELYFATTPMKERLLELALPSIRDYFDWIVLDVPSGLGLWSWNAVYVSDLVVSPVQADEAAKRGLSQTIEWIRSIISGFRPDVSVDSLVRLVLTIVDRDNRILTEMLREHLQEEYPQMTLGVELRKRAAASQARAAHLPIFQFAESDGSRGARETVQDFAALTKEVAAHEKYVEKGITQKQKRSKAIGE